jgi:hypothetical protein
VGPASWKLAATGLTARAERDYICIRPAVHFQPGGSGHVRGLPGDYTVWVWDAARGREMFHSGKHAHPISAVALCASKHLVASASWDATVLIWRLSGS